MTDAPDKSQELHPIATEAATWFERGQGKLTKDALEALQKQLDALATDPQLGPAVASLVQVAAHLDKVLGAKAAADALLKVAMSATKALEAQNAKLEAGVQDKARQKKAAFAGFTGKQVKEQAPVFGAAAPKGAAPARSFVPPPKKIK